MDEYALNVLKLVASELRLLNGMTAAREMYGKSYFSLGIGEKIAVDQAVQGMVSGNFHAVTPEYFAGPEIKNPVGFGTNQTPPKASTAGPSAPSCSRCELYSVGNLLQGVRHA